MRIRILGPMRICDDRGSLAVRAGQQRTVLAMLALEAGRTVSTERLIAEIWGEPVPSSAVLTVQGYVFRLRRLLGPGLLLTRRGGYELALPAESVDAHMFSSLVVEGERELVLGRWDSAVRVLTRALALWRGPALADVLAGKTIAAAAARLDDARRGALSERLVAWRNRGRITVHYGPVPAQLPPDIKGFVGRGADLHRLDMLAQRGLRNTIVISGAAGIGKTALALHWAHRWRECFPDGQLFVNLRGQSAGSPMRPLDALTRFLRALGLRDDQIPTDVEQAARLYRGLLARRRCLVVLDNAADADQVRPLLPGAGPVLVTGRENLAADGMTPMNLGVLTPAEAELLLCRVLGAPALRAEPQAAAELAALCGYLPLTLLVAGAGVASQPRMSIGPQTARLRRETLDALEVAGDSMASVRAAFDLSYRALTDSARHLFRLLGLPALHDFSVAAAAALAGIDQPSATAILRELATAHLIDEPGPGRYALHDLVRGYAAERVRAFETGCEQATALGRLHGFYLARVDATTRLIYPRHIPALP